MYHPRENLEGEYSGLEHEVVDGVVESLKASAMPFVQSRVVRYGICVWFACGPCKVHANAACALQAPL